MREISELLNKIHSGDCLELMREMPDKSVDLVVTSPPYNCKKPYTGYSDDLTWDQYWDFTGRWLIESHRVLKSGGRLAVNLPWWMEKKPRRDVPYTFKNAALGVGFLFLDKILWIKGDEKNVNTSGAGWGTYLSPSGPSIRCASEPILIFSKDRRGRGVISGKGRGACIPGDMTPQEWQEWTIDTWFVRGEADPDHPAVFPEVIPERLIKLYTFPSDTVLDPFAGRGTTLSVCKKLGRNYIGIEKEPAYVEIAKKRLEKVNNHKITDFFGVED